MEVYTRVFALELTATIAVPFSGDGRNAAEILRALPPLETALFTAQISYSG